MLCAHFQTVLVCVRKRVYWTVTAPVCARLDPPAWTVQVGPGFISHYIICNSITFHVGRGHYLYNVMELILWDSLNCMKPQFSPLISDLCFCIDALPRQCNTINSSV